MLIRKNKTFPVKEALNLNLARHLAEIDIEDLDTSAITNSFHKYVTTYRGVTLLKVIYSDADEIRGSLSGPLEKLFVSKFFIEGNHPDPQDINYIPNFEKRSASGFGKSYTLPSLPGVLLNNSKQSASSDIKDIIKLSQILAIKKLVDDFKVTVSKRHDKLMADSMFSAIRDLLLKVQQIKIKVNTEYDTKTIRTLIIKDYFNLPVPKGEDWAFYTQKTPSIFMNNHFIMDALDNISDTFFSSVNKVGWIGNKNAFSHQVAGTPNCGDHYYLEKNKTVFTPLSVLIEDIGDMYDWYDPKYSYIRLQDNDQSSITTKGNDLYEVTPLDRKIAIYREPVIDNSSPSIFANLGFKRLAYLDKYDRVVSAESLHDRFIDLFQELALRGKVSDNIIQESPNFLELGFKPKLYNGQIQWTISVPGKNYSVPNSIRISESEGEYVYRAVLTNDELLKIAIDLQLINNKNFNKGDSITTSLYDYSEDLFGDLGTTPYISEGDQLLHHNLKMNEKIKKDDILVENFKYRTPRLYSSANVAPIAGRYFSLLRILDKMRLVNSTDHCRFSISVFGNDITIDVDPAVAKQLVKREVRYLINLAVDNAKIKPGDFDQKYLSKKARKYVELAFKRLFANFYNGFGCGKLNVNSLKPKDTFLPFVKASTAKGLEKGFIEWVFTLDLEKEFKKEFNIYREYHLDANKAIDLTVDDDEIDKIIENLDLSVEGKDTDEDS